MPLPTTQSWTLHPATRKSWMREILALLTVLVAANILVNAWQSWHDFRAADRQAAEQLTAQTSLVARLIEDRLRDLDGMMSATQTLIDEGKATNEALVDLTQTLKLSLGDTLIAVFDANGRMVAASHPDARNEIPGFDAIFAQVRAAPSARLWLPVVWGNRGAMVVAARHVGQTGQLDAVTIHLVPLEQHLLDNAKLIPGTALLLRDNTQRIVARVPDVAGLAVGQRLTDDGSARAGPIEGTFYALWRRDHTERLVAQQHIGLGSNAGYWTLDLGYAIGTFRDSLWASLYLNLAAAALLLAMLAGGFILIGRQRALNGRVEKYASTVSTIVENMPTPVAVVDMKSKRILLGNDALLAVFGAPADKGQPFARLFVDEAHWTRMQAESAKEPAPFQTRSGIRHMLVHCTRLAALAGKSDGDPLLVVLTDITHQHLLLKQLQTDADFDPLTGLANRRYFEKAAMQAVEHARRHHSPLSVLALDLDFFKRVNDTWGHAVGDRVLKVASRVFEAALREDDLAARIGGEEFAAILLDTPEEQARRVAERIRQTLQDTPIQLDTGETLSQTFSIGIARYDETETSLDETLKRADAALYAAKHAGRNRVRFWGEAS
ncbi:diguanylate cyclase [Paraburkholderia silviterrae]|uniref:diguanylate cyclase n=1 Tax=Paraburkholderia silviterrae TaxID=2528715 RepID=A0A4R5LY62_9BURK|nr:diguanylate cyclase [Paraburkholderia silviterrae]TDG17273.1 sensor domain-containing diguanylate cyclase [Paraburkholderia silviterrae]